VSEPQIEQPPPTMPNETFARVAAIISEQVGHELSAITLQSRFEEDLDCDALSLIEVVFACETAFGIEIPNHVADLIETAGAVHDLVDYIDAALTLKGRRA
jgi:acyl carrier protein